jgi:hypothetical protein
MGERGLCWNKGSHDSGERLEGSYGYPLGNVDYDGQNTERRLEFCKQPDN